MIYELKEKCAVAFESGAIFLNEHTLVPVVVCSRTKVSVRLVLLDADVVPDIFLLKLASFQTLQVCKTVWRTPEIIEACYDCGT